MIMYNTGMAFPFILENLASFMCPFNSITYHSSCILEDILLRHSFLAIVVVVVPLLIQSERWI